MAFCATTSINQMAMLRAYRPNDNIEGAPPNLNVIDNELALGIVYLRPGRHHPERRRQRAHPSLAVAMKATNQVLSDTPSPSLVAQLAPRSRPGCRWGRR